MIYVVILAWLNVVGAFIQLPGMLSGLWYSWVVCFLCVVVAMYLFLLNGMMKRA